MYDVPMRSMPDLSPHRNVSAFAVELTHNGGTGARPGKDGLSATAYPSGVWGSQVEITESVAPLLVHRRELRRGSGGAGKYRGGLGQTLEIENAEGAPSAFFLSFERVKYPARGRAGGADGARGIVTLSSGETLSGKGEFALLPGERLTVHTPGGGGYGDAMERDRRAVETDLRQELITEYEARTIYYHTSD